MANEEDMSRGPEPRGRAWAAGLLLAAVLASCGPLGEGRGGDPAAGDLALRFEDEPSPGVFLIEAPAARDGAKGAPGLWAAVQGLRRPERAEAVNLATGATVNVALYRAGRGAPAIRVSNEAADALGIGEKPVNVRITALRRKPVVDTN